MNIPRHPGSKGIKALADFLERQDFEILSWTAMNQSAMALLQRKDEEIMVWIVMPRRKLSDKSRIINAYRHDIQLFRKADLPDTVKKQVWLSYPREVRFFDVYPDTLKEVRYE